MREESIPRVLKRKKEGNVNARMLENVTWGENPRAGKKERNTKLDQWDWGQETRARIAEAKEVKSLHKGGKKKRFKGSLVVCQ